MMLAQGPGRRLLAAARRQSTRERRLASTTAEKHSISASQTTTYLSRYTATAAIALVSLSVGFAAGKSYITTTPDLEELKRVLPNGLPRTCCDHEDDKLTDEQKALAHKLKTIVGSENVLDGRVEDTQTLPFLKGARLGQGRALCIVTPRRLQDVVDCAQAIVDAGCVVLPQGQNTGLTGGSVPHTSNERPTVVLSLKYLDRIFPIDGGERVVCLAGVGLASLVQFLGKNFPDRESHSILGSTFLNPTTAAGVAMGSGGTQCRKGPAYTERALYLKVTTNRLKENIVEVVNTLGVKTMEEKQVGEGRDRKMDSVAYRVDTWSRWIKDGVMRYSTDDSHGKAPASDVDYINRLCQNDSKVSRCNADIDLKAKLLFWLLSMIPFPSRRKQRPFGWALIHWTQPWPFDERFVWTIPRMFLSVASTWTEMLLM
jgi:D-lactate dehydrogenase